MKKYFVIIPVHNEERQIAKVLQEVKKYTKNIIVVNDGSTDRTKEIINKIRKINILNLKKNVGKGQAMKIGANLAWRLKADGIVFLDGDYQHNPKHLPDFFKLLNKNDIIIGIRILKGKIPLYRRFGNELFIFLMKLFFAIKIEDMICGYRGFSKNGYEKIKWKSKDYGVETEMMAIIGRKKVPYQVTVVDTVYVDKYKGFSVIDGLKILFKIPLWKLKS